MAIKINFDVTHNPEEPTIILAKKNGDKLGKLNAKSIEMEDFLNDASEITFNVYKEIDGEQCDLWDKITDFKLIYCVEWDMWFEIKVEIDESHETVKTIFGTQLGHAELSQIMLYDVAINTEEDFERKIKVYNLKNEDEIVPAILYRDIDNTPAEKLEEYKDGSILHRIMEKAPHYSIRYVDHTIKDIQRTFEFDETSIYDAFQEIAEEIHCLFVLDSDSDKNGNLQRTISVYDLESNCIDCGYRGEFTDTCPKCKSTNINEGYGNDTTIFVTSDELAEDIQLSTNTDEIKNCFKLEAGDDLMTSTIRHCNPNGTDYLWYISDNTKSDMSEELVKRIDSYDEMYEHYQNEYVVELEESMESDKLEESILDEYNKLVVKYHEFNEKLEKITLPITGYPALMNAYYNTVDFQLYLQSSMMPTVEISDTTAENEAKNLANLSYASASNTDNISVSTADNIVLAAAKIVIDSRYKVKIDESVLKTKEELDGTEGVWLDDNKVLWIGNFIITNYSDDTDTITTENFNITIDDNYESYIKQKIDKVLSNGEVEDVSIVGIFKKSLEDFTEEIKLYSLNRLSSFEKSCQNCIDILTEQGVADGKTWSGKDPNLYDDLYYPYRQKLDAIAAEKSVRQKEIDLIVGVKDEDGELITYGLQSYIVKEKDKINAILNFQDYLGKDLWLEFCSFRREDKYSNDNYISDGLNNAELFQRANQFIEVAQKDIYKSAEEQCSISANLKNILAIEKFAPLVNDFEVGNWLRVMIDDKVYKLRLIRYSIDYESLDEISVEFSDAIKTRDSISDIESILSQASSMSTSYESVKRQAEQGKTSKSQLDNWVDNGLALTNMKIINNADNQNITWDSHGILCREYLSDEDSYDDKQLKIINKGLYVTDDDWLTSRAGIGNFSFYNPKTGQIEESYGVIADTLIGNLILSEEVGIYNTKNSITLDENGLIITVNPEDNEKQTAFAIQKKSSDADGNDVINQLLYVGSDGNLVINGGASIDNMFTLNEVSSAIETNKYLYFDTKLGLVLGAHDSVFKTTIDEEGIYFRQGEMEISYVKNNKLHIPHAVIEKSLALGKEEDGKERFIFYVHENGSVSVIWEDKKFEEVGDV